MPRERTWRVRGREVVWYRRRGDDDEGLFNVVVGLGLLGVVAAVSAGAFVGAAMVGRPWAPLLLVAGGVAATYALVFVVSLGLSLLAFWRAARILDGR